jgi:hypothetical protein
MPSKLTIEAIVPAGCAVLVLRARFPGGEVVRNLEYMPENSHADESRSVSPRLCSSCSFAPALLLIRPVPRPSIYDEFVYSGPVDPAGSVSVTCTYGQSGRALCDPGTLRIGDWRWAGCGGGPYLSEVDTGSETGGDRPQGQH